MQGTGIKKTGACPAPGTIYTFSNTNTRLE